MRHREVRDVYPIAARRPADEDIGERVGAVVIGLRLTEESVVDTVGDSIAAVLEQVQGDVGEARLVRVDAVAVIEPDAITETGGAARGREVLRHHHQGIGLGRHLERVAAVFVGDRPVDRVARGGSALDHDTGNACLASLLDAVAV